MRKCVVSGMLGAISLSLLLTGCGKNTAEATENSIDEYVVEEADENLSQSESDGADENLSQSESDGADENLSQSETDKTDENSGQSENDNTETSNDPSKESEEQTETRKIDLEVSSNQVILVEATGSTASLTFYERESSEDDFTAILSTDASIGANGIGKTKEGDRKTPSGEYGFLFAFGNKANPGTDMPYTKVDNSYYWVDDVNSAYYNQFVSTNSVTKDWTSAEHIAGVSDSYNYVLALDYNSACVKGAGSAIFLHCRPTGGAGCIAVDESVMVQILELIEPGCRILIK